MINLNKIFNILIYLILNQFFICSVIYSMDISIYIPDSETEYSNFISSSNSNNISTFLLEPLLDTLEEVQVIEEFQKNHNLYLNKRFYSGQHLLHIAAKKGWTDLFKILICQYPSINTNINITDNSRHTPLYLALVNKHFDIVKMILSLESVDTQTKYNNQTIFDIALQNSTSKEDLEIVKLILKKNPELYNISSTIKNAICNTKTKYELIKILLNKVENLNKAKKSAKKELNNFNKVLIGTSLSLCAYILLLISLN